MSIVADIRRSYGAPRAVIRARLSEGVREDRVLMLVMLGCGLVFVAQWPRLAREAHMSDEVPLNALMGGALLGWGMIAPLLIYAIAAISHLVARLAGGQGTHFGARLALAWALVAAAPLWLLHGLLAGMVGPGAGLSLVGLLALGAFLYIWLFGLIEAESAGRVTP